MASASATIPIGYKQTEVGVIPEDWVVFSLGDFINYTKGFAFRSKDYQEYGTRILQVSDTDARGINDKNATYIDSTKAEKYSKWALRFGDIVVSTVGSKPPMYNSIVAKSTFIPEKYVGALLNQNAVILRTKNGSISEQIILHNHFQTKRYSNHIETIFRGNANQASITLVELFEFMIPFPTNKIESERIGEIIDDTDSQIQALESLISKKRNIKQATMQELLTGKTRLPGFSGEWDAKSLGQIGDISGAGVDKKIIEGETPVRLVNYLDVYNRSFIYSDELDHHVTAPPSKAIKCSVRKGDVFFTPTSEVRDDIAVSAIAMENIPDGTYSYHVVRLRIRDDWDLNYRAYAFQTKAFLDQAAVLSDGSGTRYVISLPNFRKLKVLVPSKREQQAIGQILSDMDAEIAALEQRLEKTKAIKQGMMQQLLTGRIRLVDPSTPVEASA